MWMKIQILKLWLFSANDESEIMCFILYNLYEMKLLCVSHFIVIYEMKYALEFWLIFEWIILHSAQSATLFTLNHSQSAEL